MASNHIKLKQGHTFAISEKDTQTSFNHALEIAAAYIRVSTDDQTELSPDSQLQVILNAAKADGYIIPKEYIFMEKKGISGRKADNRPEFQRMISLAKSQSPAPFARIYLWKFSRFARNQEESTFYKGILRKKCSVEVISVSEPIIEGMFGRLVETIIEWSDEYYSINLSGEVLRGMNSKARKKGYQCTPCLGYSAVGNGNPYVINETEYSIVEFIYAYYHDGHDLTAVARECNRRGYRTQRGNPFERRTVERILRNKFYIGTVEWNGIVFQGAHEVRPFITGIFEEIQERLDLEYKPMKRREVSSCRHWLSGLLVCGTCGSTLAFQVSNNTQKHSSCFQCWKYAKGYHTGSCSISVKKAEGAVLKSLRTAMITGDIQFECIKKVDKKIEDERAFLESSLTRLDMKERKIKDAYENDIDTLEEYKTNKERLKQERIRLKQELETLSINEPKAVPKAIQKAEIMKNINTALELIYNSDVDYELKGAALRRIVKKIVYHRQENQFEFFYYI